MNGLTETELEADRNAAEARAALAETRDFLTDEDREALVRIIENFAETRGALMVDGDSFGIPYDRIDELVDTLAAGFRRTEGSA